MLGRCDKLMKFLQYDYFQLYFKISMYHSVYCLQILSGHTNFLSISWCIPCPFEDKRHKMEQGKGRGHRAQVTCLNSNEQRRIGWISHFRSTGFTFFESQCLQMHFWAIYRGKKLGQLADPQPPCHGSTSWVPLGFSSMAQGIMTNGFFDDTHYETSMVGKSSHISNT